MLSEYLAAHEPEPFILLGERLNPFSLGHAILLHRFTPKLFSDPDNAKAHDLNVAVFICANTYEYASQGMRNGDVLKWCKRFAARLKRICVAKKKTPNVSEEVAILLEYIALGLKCPTVWREDTEDATIKSGAPELALLKVSMMADLGLSESVVLNRPLALCYYEHFALQEFRGKLHIDGEQDEARRRAVAKCLEKHPELTQ